MAVRGLKGLGMQACRHGTHTYFGLRKKNLRIKKLVAWLSGHAAAGERESGGNAYGEHWENGWEDACQARHRINITQRKNGAPLRPSFPIRE